MSDPVVEEEPVRCTCGLPLTAAESRARGLGRVCYERLHGKPPPRQRRTAHRPRPATPAAAVEPIPGQTELLLPGIDWSDIDDDPDDDWPEPEPRHRDLDGQGLTARQLHTMTTVTVKGSYL